MTQRKAARRFFIEGNAQIGDAIEIDASDAHKIAHVLRLRQGDRLEVVDSAARTFIATIDDLGRTVRANLVEELGRHGSSPPSLRIDVAQAVPKGQRMDFVVEKCTELGARAFIPFYGERNVGRAGPAKLERWRRLARAAAQQSGRADIPAVLDPIRYGALLERFDAYDVVLFAWELAPAAALRGTLTAKLPAAGAALLVIGPEGGFTHAEAEAAAARGAATISLGRRILRTDTAAVALLAVIDALTS